MERWENGQVLTVNSSDFHYNKEIISCFYQKKSLNWRRKEIKRPTAEMANTNGGFGKIAISAAGKFEKNSSNYIEERL